MTYDERIEKVKVALREAFLRQKIDPWGGIDVSTVIPPFDWDAIARAADAMVLQCIEEPTEGMCIGAQFTAEPYKDQPDADMVRRIGKRHAGLVYRAMIRAIPRGDT